ncbi:hypothetical protein D3C79_834490 [compost metagenome]
MVAGVVAGVHHRHHDKALARQRRRQVVQGQRAAGIAVGQHQQRELAQRYRRLFTHVDRVAVYPAAAGIADGRVERQRLHGPGVDRVGQGHVVQAGNPGRSLGVGQQAAEQGQHQHAA